MAIGAISSYTQGGLRQQNGVRQDLMTLQDALSSGNLALAQQALSRYQQDLQNTRPQQNGIRESAQVNPDSTMRSDLQALQSALGSGDLAMVEAAFIRTQQDNRQIHSAGSDTKALPTGQGASAVPEETNEIAAFDHANGNGNLLNVMA